MERGVNIEVNLHPITPYSCKAIYFKFTTCPVLTLGPQKHFLCIVVGPDSSYSPSKSTSAGMCSENDKIEPSIQPEYLSSGDSTTPTFPWRTLGP